MALDDAAIDALNRWMDEKFTSLYLDLNKLHPGLMEWMRFMRKPRWWRRADRRAWEQVCETFARHGILLTDDRAEHFEAVCRNNPQRWDEDAGGSIVRCLRRSFGYAFLGPYVKILDEE